MDDIKRMLEDIKNAQTPTSQLVEDGRADVIIANGCVTAAKQYIMDVKDRARRQARIAKNLPLFDAKCRRKNHETTC